MTIDWAHFTPWSSLAGGALIGLAFLFLAAALVVALLGAVVMGAGVVARVGLGGEGVRSSVVALAPEDGGAAVFQDQVSRTGILLSHRFALSDDTVMAAAALDAGSAQAGGADLVRTGGEADGFRHLFAVGDFGVGPAPGFDLAGADETDAAILDDADDAPRERAADIEAGGETNAVQQLHRAQSATG